MRILKTQIFEELLKNVLKKYEMSLPAITDYIDNKLCVDYQRFDRCSGYAGKDVRKGRLALKEYNLSKSEGLRIMILLVNDLIIPLYCYKKGEIKAESEIIKRVKETLSKIIVELD